MKQTRGRWHTFGNAPIFHPVRRKSSERRSIRTVIRNSSEHLRDIPAPNWVVPRQLLERAVKADVLDRYLTLRATKTAVKIPERIEDWAILYMIPSVRASVDSLLEKRFLGGIPTVLEVGMGGVPYVVTSRYDEAAFVIFEGLGTENLLELERHKPNGMGVRAGVSFRRTDRVRDVVLGVCARDVPTIPARREQDTHHNAFLALALWELVRQWVGLLLIQASEEGGPVRGSRAHRTSGGRAGDHAEARRELLNVGATMKVVDARL